MEISKLKMILKCKIENRKFPAKGDFGFYFWKRIILLTKVLKHLPFLHPKCGYRFLWFLKTHALTLFVLYADYYFFEAVGLQRYAAMNGGIVLW